MKGPTLLVVAKAPVPGFAKTRIAQTIGDEAAAELAAAALLDTLGTVSALGWPVVVAMTGDLDAATLSADIATALQAVTVIEQRGDDLGERLAHAHADAASQDDSGSLGTVQIGMDTPHVTVDDLLTAGHAVLDGRRVIGPADDGGWWLLGLPDPAEASALVDVPMSTDRTGELTEQALGGDLEHLRSMTDMDDWQDALEIATLAPVSRLAVVVDAVQATELTEVAE